MVKAQSSSDGVARVDPEPGEPAWVFFDLKETGIGVPERGKGVHGIRVICPLLPYHAFVLGESNSRRRIGNVKARLGGKFAPLSELNENKENWKTERGREYEKHRTRGHKSLSPF
jgi:hypothetical protein